MDWLAYALIAVVVVLVVLPPTSIPITSPIYAVVLIVVIAIFLFLRSKISAFSEMHKKFRKFV